MTSKTNDSIKRTGDLLLSGWRLLNSACPICNTALLSKNEMLRCPSCDLAVVKESDQQKFTNESSSLPAPPAVAEAKFEIEDDYYQYATNVPAKFESLNDAKKLYDAQNKKMNQVSDKLGAKMLSGFSMLSTVCPNEDCRGTPLCRQGTGPMVCVCCDSEYKVSSLGDLIPTLKTASASETFNGKVTLADVQSAAKTTTATSVAPAVTSTHTATSSAPAPTKLNLVATADEILPASEADNAFFLNMHNAPILDLSSFGRESESDCSSKIAKKLMLGWALLDKCCEEKGCKGEVPLMRDQDGVERCVQCGLPDSTTTTITAPTTHTTNNNATGQQTSTIPDISHKRPYSSATDYSDYDDSDSEDADFAKFYEHRAAQEALRAKAASTKAVTENNPTVGRNGGNGGKPMEQMCFKPSVTSYSKDAIKSLMPVVAPVTAARAGAANREVVTAVEVVKQKLVESTAGLASAQNIDTQIKYADLIGKLASALGALQKVEC